MKEKIASGSMYITDAAEVIRPIDMVKNITVKPIIETIPVTESDCTFSITVG